MKQQWLRGWRSDTKYKLSYGTFHLWMFDMQNPKGCCYFYNPEETEAHTLCIRTGSNTLSFQLSATAIWLSSQVPKWFKFEVQNHPWKEVPFTLAFKRPFTSNSAELAFTGAFLLKLRCTCIKKCSHLTGQMSSLFSLVTLFWLFSAAKPNLNPVPAWENATADAQPSRRSPESGGSHQSPLQTGPPRVPVEEEGGMTDQQIAGV